MKKQVWVVVANGSLTKIYKAENVHSLVEIKSFEHPESHLSGHELSDSKPTRGDIMWSTGIHGGVQEKLNPKTKEAQAFAKQVAEYLEDACQKGTCHSLYLFASPFFLGLLREYLGPLASKAIKGEANKDLTQQKPSEILKYLPPTL